MSIAGVDELIDFMSNVSLTADQREAAELVLEGVQAEVETYCNRLLEATEIIERLTPDEYGHVYVTQTPVTEILHVRTPPPSPLPVPYVPVDVYHEFFDGWLVVNGYGAVEVRYKAGLPAHAYRFLKLEVLRIAAREMEDRHDDTLGVTELNTRPPAPRPIGLQDDDRKRLDRWRRRVAV